jgi:anaerobic selenocysteine-containing dehydrogenase
MNDIPDAIPSRREFLKTSAAAGVAGTLLSTFASPAHVYADGNDVIKVGLIGCGGRGTGAANQALRGDPNARLVAMGDAFEEKSSPACAHFGLKRTSPTKFSWTMITSFPDWIPTGM